MARSETLIPGAENSYLLKDLYSFNTKPNRNVMPYILLTQTFYSFSLYGFTANLVDFFQTFLNVGQNRAAVLSNWFQALWSFGPLIGGVLADGYLGHYKTIVAGGCILFGAFTMICICILQSWMQTHLLVIFVFIFIPLGAGFVNSCLSCFGADQYNPELHTKQRENFFRWAYFCGNVGAILAYTLPPYLQEHVGWFIGLLIPTLGAILIALPMILGASKFRYRVQQNRNPFIALSRVPLAYLYGNVRTSSGGPCPDDDVDAFHTLMAILPVIAVVSLFNVCYNQMSTTWYIQAKYLNRNIFTNSDFLVPVAFLQLFDPLFVMITIIIMSFIHSRREQREVISRNERSSNLLIKLSYGMGFVCVSLLSSAYLEHKRLQSISIFTDDISPINVFWQVI
eukprot:GHVL01005264.1.p1 GENE.GHVL01005264.1~~GHVL01005264.1.p1  ORF type:complete len:397 (+),score=34.61 GHVL01005264.1:218-1408(+)